MRIFVFVSLLFGLSFWACQSNESSVESTPEDERSAGLESLLPGTWESVSMKVFVHTVDNSDSSYIFDVPEQRWEKMLGMKPFKTVYQANNKYYSEHRTIADTLMDLTRGMWNVFGDTLMLVTPEATYQYRVQVRRGLSEFRAFIDFDGDGKEDDEYIGIQRYVSMSAE